MNLKKDDWNKINRAIGNLFNYKPTKKINNFLIYGNCFLISSTLPISPNKNKIQ